MTVAEIPTTAGNETRNGASITVYVCTTCRKPGDSDQYPRPGAALAAATLLAAESTNVVVRPIRCLGNCNRGCSAAMQRTERWTYIFGNLDPATDAEALVRGAQLLAHSTDGLMPWRDRPESLKRGLIARVPPFGFVEVETVK